MATTQSPRPMQVSNSEFAPIQANQLKVSPYDRTASMLVVALIAVGSLVTILFLIWLTSRVFVTQEVVPIEFLEGLGEGEAGGAGAGQELEEPEEQLDDIVEPDVEETLEAVTDAITDTQATLDAAETGATAGSPGQRGQGRGTGPGGGGVKTVPRWERWEIMFESSDLATYARQLDSFQIELGATGGGFPNVDYAAGFSAGTPKRRSGPPDKEDRLYMTWRHGALKAADIALLKRAGVKTDGRLILQFYPPQVEGLLASLENQYLQKENRSISDVKKTVFATKPNGNKFDFYVVEQKF